MSERNSATINIIKTLAGVPLTTLAAVGGASSNLLFAGLAALPLAVLVAYNTIESSKQAGKLTMQEENLLEIAAPFGWRENDIPAWKSFCAEIEQDLPNILHRAERRLKQSQGPVPAQALEQVFIDVLVDELQYIWLPTGTERRQVAAYIALPLLAAMNQVLAPIVEQMRREADSRNISTLREDIHELHDTFVRPKLRAEDMAQLRQQYFEALCQERLLDFKGISHHDMTRPVSIPLTEVFVLPDVQIGVPEYETLERDDVREQAVLKEREREKRRDREGERLKRRERSSSKYQRIVIQREDLRPVLAKHRRLVILGDPGAGKSTLLRYLLLTLTEKSDRFITEFPQFTTEAQVTSPLYIRLATYAEAWHDNEVGKKSLIDFLPKYLRDNYLGVYNELLHEQLQQGTLLLLFDGLDEIPDAALRMQIVRQIEAFTHSYPNNHFIVTSRIVGYREAPLAADYQVYTLADFSEVQIKAFTTRWCPAYERWVNLVEDSQALQDAATKEAEKLFLATQRNPGVKRLAVNPLLLTILSLIQRQGIALPSHRVELFDLCTTILIDTWVKTKGSVEATRFSKSELIKILCPLAFWMHQHPAVGAIPEEELMEQIVKQLLERKVTRYEDEATKLAEQFLQTVRGKTGILIERGKARYGFLHLTFEEYLAARELVAQKNRMDFIKQNLHDARWREVILLAIGCLGILDAYEEDVTELVQEAILKAESPFEPWLHRDLLFAGLCLADDVGVSVTCEEDIIQQIVYLHLTTPYDSLRTACSRVLNAWRDTPVAARAVHLVLHLIRQHETLMDTTPLVKQIEALPPDVLKLQERVHAYYQRLVQQNQESCMRLLYLHIMIILGRIEPGTKRADWVEYALVVLTDPDSDVRRTAASALGQLGSGQPEVLEVLLKALSDPNWEVRCAAAKTLGQLGSGQPKTLDALLKALTDSSWQVRCEATSALGQLGSGQPEVLEALLKNLNDFDSNVYQAAANALSQLDIGHAEVSEALLKALSDSDWLVRCAAASTLGQLGSGHPEVLEALLKTFTDSHSIVRCAAAGALGQLGSGHPEVLEALLKALSDSDWQVHCAAAGALGQLGSGHPEVLEALLKSLNDSNSNIREAAAIALGQLGSGYPEVLEALLPRDAQRDYSKRAEK